MFLLSAVGLQIFDAEVFDKRTDFVHLRFAVAEIDLHRGQKRIVRMGALQQQVAGGTPQGLTQTQFIQAVQKLRQQYPNASFETGVAGQLYNELMNRRQAGIQAGI